ncbi:gph [Symbiodinium natans]|uniref:Gph protein n=1 Tax=Symbiodinium natans TaxID=878477 RepID=A0A812QXG4_9DINO|nr:gph [Symbiodinium natans]
MNPLTETETEREREREQERSLQTLPRIFEAWVAPKVLQIKGKLPENISIAYHVPPLEQSNVENDAGPFPWKLLGSVSEQDCGFEHWIQAPEDGFLWDLAWDLPLNCVHSSNLWRDFQSALYDSVGLVPDQDSGGRSVCYVGRPGADSARQLSDKSYNALKAAARAVKLDGEPLAFLPLNFDGSVPTAQQAKTVSRCDVLIGLHGAGMSHSIWMYPGSVVVEIMDDEHLGAAYYRNIAHLSGHVYFKHDKRELEGRPQLFKQLMITAAEIISNKATYSRKVSSELPALLAKVSKKNMDIQLASLQAAVNKAASEAAMFLDRARTELQALSEDIADFTAQHNHLRKADVDYQMDLSDQQRRNDGLADQLEKLTARRRLAETRLQADMDSLRTENTVLKRSVGALSKLYEAQLLQGRRALLGVLFDVDGTLVDSTQLAFCATNEVLEKFGYPQVDVEDYHRGTKYTTPVRLAWHAGLAQNPEASPSSAESLGAEMGRVFDSTYVALVTPKSAPLFEGLKELLAALAERQVTLGVLSNAALAYVEAVLSVNNLKRFFPVWHGADSVALPKPAPDGLLQCCTELGQLKASEYVYVGDGPNDGRAARAAGMASIGVSWGSNTRETLEPDFDVVVDTAEDLTEVLLASLQDRAA